MKDVLFPLTFIALLVLAATQLTGQVSSKQQMMSRGNNDALILELPSADDKLVEDLWEDWLKDNYKVKTSKTKKVRTGELASLNFGLPGVSAGSKVDMYSHVREVGNGSELSVWIATPDGYVSPDLDQGQYLEAEKMLMRFALAVSRAQTEQDVDTQEDKLKNLEKDLDRLRRDKERAEKDIVDAQQLIAEREAEIQQNIVSQENKQREIEAQMRVVEDTKAELKKY
ncbi:hypothetical protein LEM8419_02385 [Neolewinella maritima]|uniref:Uncharacterized protein n=1 Tax=Neolewinella maritima TaxID=1383882 RepID=A0ABM9B2T6_9BACT|nr:DUF4349 domain-containing protein [Neolewinella maritima]CAH1001482.1 hypothetical protein LEM8419_02385 [Neolewinella maritima]